MKIRIDTNGASPIRPDFAMLRSSLVAAQASTPTARACEEAHRRPIAARALLDLFSHPGDAPARAMPGGRFSPDATATARRTER